MDVPKLMTIAETGVYSRKAAVLLEEEERNEIIDHLSDNPTAGDLIRESGGVRKLRWARPGRGKSAGIRIIYYFHSEELPLWLLTLFAKNEQSDLSADEVNALSRFVSVLKDGLRKMKEER